jgi:hypothetical protein
MKTLFIIIACFFTTSLYAQEKFLNQKGIQASVLETSSYLKQSLTEELQQSVGISEFTLNVEIKVNSKKLQSNLGFVDEDWKKIETMQLPGLFVEGKEEYAISPIEKAKKEDILLSLDSILVEVHYHQDNYNDEFLTKNLMKIISFNLPKLKESQINVKAFKGEAPYRKTSFRPADVLSEAFSKPLNINIDGSFEGIWNNYYKMILAGVALIILAGGLFVGLLLKGGLGSLTEAIKTKTFTTGGQSTGIKNVAPELQKKHSFETAGSDTFKSYVQANAYLKEMVEKEPKIFNELVVLKLMAEDFLSITILLDVLSQERRDLFLKNIDSNKTERFQSYIGNQGSAILRDEEMLKNEAIKMIKLVKVAALSPSKLYQIVAMELVAQLDSSELEGLVRSSTAKEKPYVLDLLESSQIAYLVQTNLVSPTELETEVAVLAKDEMIDLIIKASENRKVKAIKLRREKLESIYAQLEIEKAELVGDAIALDPKLRFDYLFNNHKEDALKYLEVMDFASLSMVFPLLNQSMQKDVIANLPELLSERLKFARKSVSAESLKLKGDFYFYLRSIQSHEESNTLSSSTAA